IGGQPDDVARVGRNFGFNEDDMEHGLYFDAPPGFAALSPTPLQGATPAAWQSQFRGVYWKGGRSARFTRDGL
ncbi:MAG: hypothetical protein KA181_01355, partial [Xylophilus sp.]|nr:hypothetical protein [Xylophilus sp.]